MPAVAADLGARYRAPAYAPPQIYNWTGFYLGAHLGGVFGGDYNFNGLALSNNDARFMVADRRLAQSHDASRRREETKTTKAARARI